VVEVADAAGFSHGAVYSNFDSKEELLLASYEEYAAKRTEEIRQAFPSGGAALAEKARAAADQWMARLEREPELFLLQLEFAAHARRMPAVLERFANREAAVPAAISRLLAEEASAEGLPLPFSADELAVILRALGNGLALERINDPRLVSLSLFGDFVAWVFEEIAASAAGTRASNPSFETPRENERRV
jgi:AcrR family transcriptional regulator